MPTIREVAQKAGVSSTTVSHVVNKTRFVSAETRQRVLAAVEELGYRPNILARSLRRGETHTLGLILPDSANPFFAEIGRSIEEVAFNLGYNVILCNTEGDLDKEARYIDVLSKKQVDGIVFVAAGDQADPLRAVLDLDMPVVVVDRDLPEVDVDVVLANNRGGGYTATRHLIELGHRRIACITGPANLTPSDQRVSGYVDALVEANLEGDESLIVRGDFHPRSGREATQCLLNLANPPTAIFACNDLMAIGALYAAAEVKRLVPETLAIVGFDDIELASYTMPPLTTIAQKKEEIGRMAVQFLTKRIIDNTLPVRRLMLECTLVVRRSCGSRK